MKLKSLLTETAYAGKTYISVDIQPEYKKAFSFLGPFVDFLNENSPAFNDLIFLYNGQETLGMINEDDYKMWWMENGLQEDIVYNATFYDKGYAFFRYCMDSSIDEDAIANFVRFMYENDVHDSRDMDREKWAKYLREYRRLDRKEVYELLKHTGDCIHIPDLMDFLKRYRNPVLTGGGINECLKEVEIAMKALRIEYEVDDNYTY